jgi:hypothetical protein
MSPWTPNAEAGRHRAHVIRGLWSTKSLRIDGEEITLEMVKTRLRRDAWYAPQSFAAVRRFAWGATATLEELQLLAYGCCEFAVPELWVRAVTSRFALEQWFAARLRRLPATDFTLSYSEPELRRVIRRLKRRRPIFGP